MSIITGISLTDKTLLTKHMTVMLRSGLTITESVDIAADQATGNMKKVLTDIRNGISSGKSFSAGLAKYPRVFSPLYVNIVDVGEKSGTLVESLEQLSVQLEKQNELRSKIFQALLYPVIVLFAVVLVGGGISVFVLPRLTSLFAVFQGEIPLATQVLLVIVDLLADYGFFFFPALFVIFILFLIAIRIEAVKPIWHALLVRIPIVAPITKNVNLAQFSRNLGTLLKSGLPITQSLNIVANATANRAYQKKIRKVLKGIEQGKSMNAVMSKMDTLFPKITTRMINIGEKSGKLDEVLLYLAEFYENEVDKSSKTLQTTLEPILLIVIGLVVGFVMIAIITPIYELTSTIGS